MHVGVSWEQHNETRFGYRWMSEVNGHDCIVCPYHGWAFDDEGKLRDVPAAENNNEWPKKPLVDSFPVQEKVNNLNASPVDRPCPFALIDKG